MSTHDSVPQKQSLLSPSTVPRDLTAGLVVFLVALPLCLGIALASGAPLFSGLLAGIIGGLVVGSISGSQTSVSGPAAGLTAIVAAQIATLGSFQAFLLAVLIAGVLQVGLGIAKAGSISAFVPSSVIKGLLAAIGVILILKQFPHVLGHDADPEGDMSFIQPDDENTFSELGHTFLGEVHSGAIVVGLLSGKKRCQEPFFAFLGRPRGRRVLSSPSRRTMRSLQEESPNGQPRCTHRRSAARSASVSGVFTC